MLSFWTILSATAPVFIVIAAGCFMSRRGWLGEELELGTMRLVLNLFLPCLILTVIPGNPALEKVSSALWSVGTGFSLVIVGFSVAALVGWLVRLKKGDGLRTFTITAGIQNYGYLPIPIIAELFSDKSGPMGLVFVHGIGVEMAIWSVGLFILTRKAGWRSIVNGPFVAVFTALILNYSGLHLFIPKPIVTSMVMLGQCAIPLSIFMIGATMGSFFKRDVLTDAWRVSHRQPHRQNGDIDRRYPYSGEDTSFPAGFEDPAGHPGRDALSRFPDYPGEDLWRKSFGGDSSRSRHVDRERNHLASGDFFRAALDQLAGSSLRQVSSSDSSVGASSPRRVWVSSRLRWVLGGRSSRSLLRSTVRLCTWASAWPWVCSA